MTLISLLINVVGQFYHATAVCADPVSLRYDLLISHPSFYMSICNPLSSLCLRLMKHHMDSKPNRKSHQCIWCFSIEYRQYNIQIESSTVAIILLLYAAAACVYCLLRLLCSSCDRDQFIASVWNCGGRKITPTSLTDGPLNLFLLSAKSAWRDAPWVCIQTCLMLQDSAATLQLNRMSSRRMVVINKTIWQRTHILWSSFSTLRAIIVDEHEINLQQFW